MALARSTPKAAAASMPAASSSSSSTSSSSVATAAAAAAGVTHKHHRAQLTLAAVNEQLQQQQQQCEEVEVDGEDLLPAPLSPTTAPSSTLVGGSGSSPVRSTAHSSSFSTVAGSRLGHVPPKVQRHPKSPRSPKSPVTSRAMHGSMSPLGLGTAHVGHNHRRLRSTSTSSSSTSGSSGNIGSGSASSESRSRSQSINSGDVAQGLLDVETSEALLSMPPVADMMNSRLVNLAGPDYIEATYGPMVRHLGSGTGGSVALHGFKSSSTYVAVKSYSFPAHTTFAQRLRHVESEARVALSMNQANVIRTHEFCFELTPSGTASRDGTLLKTGTFYAVMDYCVTDMFEYINRRDLSPQAIESVFVQLVAGVHHMHTVHRVAHRDIKLDNIGVAADGSIKLIDFGCARILPPGSDYTRGACGSEPYIPMEAILSYPTTSAHTSAAVHAAYQQLCYDAFKVDVWSIAVVFLALLSRHFPWSAARVTDANFAMYLEHGSHALDHWLRDPGVVHTDEQMASGQYKLHPAAPLIKRMLAIDPAERPSISEVIADPWFQSLINSSNSNSSSKSRTA